MEIVFKNVAVKVESAPLITKGTNPIDISGASVTSSTIFKDVWSLNACTGLSRVTGINFVPGEYTTDRETMTESRFYKVNKTTGLWTQVIAYTPTQAEIGQLKHLDVNVQLGENEYIGIVGVMYYKASGSSSFSVNTSSHVVSADGNVMLYYNIEGFE